jgi:hypothetical protein
LFTAPIWCHLLSLEQRLWPFLSYTSFKKFRAHELSDGYTSCMRSYTTSFCCSEPRFLFDALWSACGVRQGSVLEPALLIHFNDLCYFIKHSRYLFVGDINIFPLKALSLNVHTYRQTLHSQLVCR